MGLLDDLGLSDVGNFITNNAGWLKPAANIGLSALKQSQADDTQSQYLDYLKQRENQNYQNSVDQINAYNAAQAGNYAAASGRAAAARAAGAGRAAAARVTAQKVNAVQQNMYKKLLAMYAPYKASADALLPQMQHTYEGALNLQNSLASQLSTPEALAKLNQFTPTTQFQLPLPDYMKGTS